MEGGFSEKVEDASKEFATDPYDISEPLRALRPLLTKKRATKRELAAGYEALQARALATMVLASTDMNRLDPLHIDHEETENPEKPQGGDDEPRKEEKVKARVALVNRMRDDVQLHDDRPAKLRQRALVWHRTNLTTTLVRNDDSMERKFLVPSRDWRKRVLDGIKAALEQGANIISLGEFDYPPDLSREEDKAFTIEILELINHWPQPVFLFAGSSHNRTQLTSQSLGEDVGELLADNRGYVFYNHALIEGKVKPRHANPMPVQKRTPALKMGERLTRLDGLKIRTFSTLFGNILVLICSDAYDPTIVFEVFSQCEQGNDHVDIVIVAAYNLSPKLSRMCQLLSLLSDSVVIFLDVCSESTEDAGKCQSGIWNCGWPAEGVNGISQPDEVPLSGGGHLSISDIDIDRVRDFKGKFSSAKLMPLFGSARTIVRPGSKK